MVAETVFGAILVILAVCAGVGLPLLAVHFQQREVHERQRCRSSAGHVQRRFCDRRDRAGAWIDRAPRRICVRAERQRTTAPLDTRRCELQ